MRRETHHRIRKSRPGLNVVADIDSVVVVNDGRARRDRAGEREASRAATPHEAHRPSDGEATSGSADQAERTDSPGGT
jgi:hypothetical protein